MSKQDHNGYTESFELESELFPAFRKAMSVTREMSPEKQSGSYEPYKSSISLSEDGASADDITDNADFFDASQLPDRETYPEKNVSARPAGKEQEQSGNEEKIPALFGDVCLDKYKKQEEPVHEPTLLEFLNQDPDDAPLPVPSLFDGIGKEYYASDEILRLAAEAEAEENASIAYMEAADGAQDSDDASQEEEPAPDADELFGMINSIYNQQREDWDRHVYSNHMSVKRSRDPYNTAFNNRQPVINYDNVDEFPMPEKYDLTPVESPKKTASPKPKRQRGTSGERRHFKIYK